MWSHGAATAAPHIETLVQELRRAGAGHLQVIFDFDHTLTRFRHPSGERMPMSHDVMERAPSMPEAFREDFAQIWAELHASKAAGNPDLRRWWRDASDLLLKHGLRREWIPGIVEHSKLALRDQCVELFEFLEAKKIPCAICSAGFTEIIKETLRRQGVSMSNIYVRANEIEFDEEGKIIGLPDPIVSSLDKGDFGVWDAEYFARIDRKHVILVGDSVRDPDSLASIAGVERAIRIGLFDADVRRDLAQQYQEAFDLVLSSEGLEPTQDLDMSFVYDLVQEVAMSEPSQPA